MREKRKIYSHGNVSVLSQPSHLTVVGAVLNYPAELLQLLVCYPASAWRQPPRWLLLHTNYIGNDRNRWQARGHTGALILKFKAIMLLIEVDPCDL